MTDEIVPMASLVNTDADINFILDRSGSMFGKEMDIIGGFNRFIREQIANEESDAFISLYQFDNNYRVDFEAVDVRSVKPLDKTSYAPEGGTALLDAIGVTVKKVEQRRKSTPPQDLPGKVMVIIMTDGEENQSHKFNKQMIADLVENKKKEGWGFLFIGANIDSFTVGKSYGIGARSSGNYAHNSQGIENAFKGISNSVTRSRKSYQSPSEALTYDPDDEF